MITKEEAAQAAEAQVQKQLPGLIACFPNISETQVKVLSNALRLAFLEGGRFGNNAMAQDAMRVLRR